MTTTTRPGDRLRKHADDLRSGRLTWVEGTYPSSGEAGAVVILVVNGVGKLYCNLPTTTTKEQGISALEAAAELLDKEGE